MIEGKTAYINDIFDRGGAFDTYLDTYEVRPGQIDLANAFDQSIRERRSLVAEAPCGSGKGFAYLVPAIYHTVVNSVGSTIVATANITLQEQLIEKDLPFLKKVLPWDFTYGLAKGRSNYLCRYYHRQPASATLGKTNPQRPIWVVARPHE